ncbi:Phosphatidylinositide phosphatase SAC2 [Araneus ventricosus]|uniref:Phosphatidylinositide phosphatase SAC2 n=1 Tax=Araneus ventricosus TaxID=182803 RepID=A0A4Y2HZG3_ARAVE|nr:Phosphatidylinositide phosphatase SAC2 [Araneus ventricosus]
MELLMNSDYYVLLNNDHSLWCSRSDGSMTPKCSKEVEKLTDFVCIGIVFGVIGKFTIQQDIDKRLVVIKDRAVVGVLPGGHDVYKIQKIAMLPLNQQHLPDVEFEVCKKHRFNPKKADKPSNNPDVQQKAFQKTWNTLKAATSQVKSRKVYSSLISAASLLASRILIPAILDQVELGPWSQFSQILAIKQPKELRDRDKLEKRVIEEFTKMFTDTDSFYYSFTGDLTNSIQRMYYQSKDPEYKGLPLWKRIDDRFFWNKYMLSELINLHDPLCDPWIIPVIQGFVQIEQCWIDIIDDAESLSAEGARFFPPPVLLPETTGKNYTMSLISRRSRHRAGTRYKRRGVDESGKCANYVETEQIFEFASHTVSFVQTRGSVPIFWSQPGYKYRPPPQLDKGEEETQTAFEKHFEEELSIYNKHVVIINLMEQTGKEKIINDAYLKHILEFSCPDLTYVSFDFHEYCRGMKFENVSVLIESIQDIIRDTRYCWTDSEGLICEQRGVFRVNCVDCLDRTNIVQTALAKTVMDIQFNKLGLLPPEGVLPAGCRRIFQMLWANNGDIISRQYAGTVALKGDYTRTGERRIAGMMKDGYHSANRYYMNRFKDAFRQATIDLMMGNPVTEDIHAVTPEREEVDPENEINEQEHHERVKQLIEDCKKILIPDTEVVLGGWALIDADPVTGDPDKQDMDAILILTKDSYFVAEYDDQTDRIIKYQHVLLEDLERIELGPEPGVFKSKHCCLRLHYSVYGQSGYFHMFRSTNTRFFNNMAVPIKSEEEAAESLKAICETFKVALSVKEINVPIFEGKLERRKSKMPLSQVGVRASVFRSNRSHHGYSPNHGFHLELPSFSSMPRNISEGQLNSLKTVGSRALSNVTSHFAKLNPIRTVKALGKKSGNGIASHVPTNLASVDERSVSMSPRFSMDSSSESEEDSVLHHKTYTAAGFHGHISDRTLSSDYSEFSDVDEQEMMLSTECLNNGANDNKHDDVLESCGILATYNFKTNQPNNNNFVFLDDPSHFNQRRYDTEVDDFVLDAMKKASIRHMNRKASLNEESKCKKQLPLTSMPQIHISTESNLAAYTKPDEAGCSSGKAAVCRKLSKSSEDLEYRPCTVATSHEVSHLLVQEEVMLDTDGLNAKMKTSHSESAIQDFSLSSLNLSSTLSPIAIKKDLVLSPLSRIAKGVQSFGMNLRPGHHRASPISPDNEDYEKVKLKRKKCATRIIEL